jgi:hypothetical protein
MAATPLRNIRVDATLWRAAAAKAALDHRTLTDVIVTALRAYVAGQPAHSTPAPDHAEQNGIL